ncbi:MAG: tRNA hydroxylase [Myxococcales bacterium]|jgi:tRNA-(ms[2]io[6]A)-hydroxylase|nr:tRNA hydroxylase [Myxococcales bacterium]
MLHLKLETDPRWVDLATADPKALLADHALCERKAALTALSLVVAFGDDHESRAQLADLAAEETSHLQAVLNLMTKRGWDLPPDGGDEYVQRLMVLAKPDKGHGLLDRLLIAALIEARSTERLRLLAEHHPDEDARRLCDALWKVEARHSSLFLALAEKRFGREMSRKRLKQLSEREAQVVASLPALPRVH